MIKTDINRRAEMFSTFSIHAPSYTKCASVVNSFLHPLKEFATAIQGISVGCLPLNVLEVGMSCKSLVTDPPNKKLNASLDIISGIKEIGEGITGLMEFLVGVKAVSEAAAAWSGPFGLVMSALSIVSIAKRAKIIKETNDLLNEFDAIVEETSHEGKINAASYTAVMKLLENKQNEDSDFLTDVFNVKEAVFAHALLDRKKTIDERLASPDQNEQEKGDHLAAQMVKSLRGRIQKNITSSAVSIVASIVNMIGSILIFLCPVLPVGWALVGASSIIDGGKLVHHKISEYLFAQEIGFTRTRLEWLVC